MRKHQFGTVLELAGGFQRCGGIDDFHLISSYKTAGFVFTGGFQFSADSRRNTEVTFNVVFQLSDKLMDFRIRHIVRNDREKDQFLMSAASVEGQ